MALNSSVARRKFRLALMPSAGMTTIRGRVALKFDGHAVEPSDPQGADAVVRIEWDEFTRMVYGIEGFTELLASGAATVCARGVSRKVVRAMAAAFPRLKFHVWRVDHW